MWLHALVIFLSAFLLFLVQPLIARQILPWFGGGASVWATSLAFFQLALLAGYAYSDLVTRRLAPRPQALLHGGLLLAALAFLPIAVDPAFRPDSVSVPGLRILLILLVSIGLPFFLLASTAPLIQAWYAEQAAERAERQGPEPLSAAREDRVYRLFSLSNLAALVALVSYPFLIEPLMPMSTQILWWSAGFVLFVLGVGVLAFRRFLRASSPASGLKESRPAPALLLRESAARQKVPAPGRGRLAAWFGLSATGALLLVATSSHITRDVASVPFLWILPLSLYLLSFVLCFESDRWYRRWLFLPLAAVSALAGAWGLGADRINYDYIVLLGLYAGGLFAICMAVHGELAADRPHPAWLTRYYLVLALGGACGGLMAALLAPALFRGPWELGLGYVAFGALILAFLGTLARPLRIAAALVPLVAALLLGQHIRETTAEAREMVRNFYGTVMTVDWVPDQTGHARRALIDGVIWHGAQYLDGPMRTMPIAYYGPDSGVGQVMALLPERPRRIGVLGLGAGTMAAFGRKGDAITFYEINPAVIAIARSEFSYLSKSAAKVTVVAGDGRLALEAAPDGGFDLLLMDAFSSGSVPMHLLTREAMAVYERHLAEGGVMIFNVTNRYVDLVGPLKRIAASKGLGALHVADRPRAPGFSMTDYVVIGRGGGLLTALASSMGRDIVTAGNPGPVWTDDHNDLVRALYLRDRFHGWIARAGRLIGR